MATSIKSPATFFGAIRNLGKAAYNWTAKLASYNAAIPSNSTQIGSRIGTNPNSSYANMQRVGMQFTAENVGKNCPLGMAYMRVRNIYCRPQKYKPDTGDSGLNSAIVALCDEKWKTMGVACSMQSAVARTLHLETPMRGDAGMIIWRDGANDLRLIEFCADQLGALDYYGRPRRCSLTKNAFGNLAETIGSDLLYFGGRYFRGPDCVAYKICDRDESYYSNPQIYDAADVIYTVDPFNFLGMRGVTIFANVMDCVQKGEDLLQAALSIAQRQARTAAFVYNNSGAGSEFDSEVLSDGTSRYFERIGNAPIYEYNFVGDKVDQVAPNAPGTDVINGVESADERFCVGLGMTYAFVMSCKNLGGAPSRLDCNRSGKEIERIQNDISLPCLERIAQVTILDAVRKGELPPLPGITKGHWTFTNSPTADAYKDSMDDIKSVRAGQDSDSRVLGRYGTTYDEVMTDRENEAFRKYVALDNVNKRLKAANIKATATIADIAQVSDNPQQAAAAEQIDDGVIPTKTNGTNGNGFHAPAARMAALDFETALFEESEGRWITVNGSPVLIKEGQDAGDAVKEHFKSGAKGPKGDAPKTGETQRSDVRSKRAEVGDLHGATKQGKGKDSTLTMADGSPAPEHIKAA